MNHLSTLLIISTLTIIISCGGKTAPGSDNQGNTIDGDKYIDPDSHAGRVHRAEQKVRSDRNSWSKHRELFFLKEKNIREMKRRDKLLRH